MYTGKIYLSDHEGMPVGIPQDVEVRQHDGGYAAFLVSGEDSFQISDPFETEAACVSHLKGGGTTTVVIDDL